MTVNSPSQDDRDASSRTVAERLLPLLPIGAAMFTLSALVYYHLRHGSLDVRSPLQLLVAWTYRSFGFAPAFLGCLLLLTWGSIWFAAGRCTRVGSRLLRLAATVVMLGVFLNLGDGGVNAAYHKGELGAWLAGGLVGALGYYPSVLVVWATTVGALLLATDFFFREEFERMRTQPESAPERGVEVEVTEVLKGLGAEVAVPVVPVAPAAATAVRVASVAAPAAEVSRELAVGRHDDEVEFEPEVEAATPPRSRPSYYERRYAAVAEDADDWEPQEPESQEFDNAETAATFAADSIDVQEETAEQFGDEVFVVTESVATEADLAEAGDTVDPVTVEAEDEAEFEDALDVAEHGTSVVDAAPAAPSGMAQRSLFDEPPPAPRAQIGEWLQDYETPAAAASGELDAVSDKSESAADADAEDWSEAADEDDVVAAEVDAADEVELLEERAEVEVAGSITAEVADEAGAVDEIDAGENVGDGAPKVDLPAERRQATQPEADVPIPRPEAPPTRKLQAAGSRYPAGLVEDATALVVESGRASAALLQRKLRIDFDTALGLLAELSRLGVVELSADAVHGRVLR